MTAIQLQFSSLSLSDNARKAWSEYHKGLKISARLSMSLKFKKDVN
jgi:hypothetical protein